MEDKEPAGRGGWRSAGDLEKMVVFRALSLWEFNVSDTEKFDAVYGPTEDEGYLQEKLKTIHRGVLHWSSVLDYRLQKRLVDAALARYGVEAYHWTVGAHHARD